MIENVGWVKGTAVQWQDHKMVAFCASGALSTVEVTDPKHRHLAFERLTRAIPETHSSIVFFNDYKKTTKKMVLKAFDRAIKANR